MTEEWKSVVDYEGRYEVSNRGYVRSIARPGSQPQGVTISVGKRPSAYPFVRLHKDGCTKSFRVHTLVALAFLGPRLVGHECRHLNGDPTDNRLENLAWGTRAENARDMVEHGRTNVRKTHCPRGHEYDQANTHWYKGRRFCRACNRIASRTVRQRRRTERLESAVA